ncbi:MAG: ribonuclease HII [Peptostreptococcaceae bacterium]|nr:ribonuclease HII [Peptostreptococcaceae bacterium]
MEKMSVKEIKRIADTLPKEKMPELIGLLVGDRRSSVKKIALSLSKKLEAFLREEERLKEMFAFEESFMRQGAGRIGGVDEAGRGPLAGPVCAACVVFRKNPMIEGINDSKKLSEKRREELFEQIVDGADAYGIGTADAAEIDESNILEATMLAMRRAVEACGEKPDFLLVDGNQMIRKLSLPQKTVVGGDARSLSIAAASILAKVSRDRLMGEFARLYPQYGFEKHKGYGTQEHREALQRYGPSPIHRRSFLTNIL